jgi:DNA repair protein RecO (recombination protein O)
MGASGKPRFDDEPAYVLHSYPFRETSLLVETLTRHHGRVALVARGARRPKSALRGVLLSFRPLLLSWFGGHELKTLHKAEWQGGALTPQGMGLVCGFYLNELLLRLTAREDPHERLFDYYTQTLAELAAAADYAAVLRRFERRLMEELGYALMLEHEAGGARAIQPDADYRYLPERGPVPASQAAEGVQLRGKTLLDMARDDYSDVITQQQGKQLMRALIGHHLDGGALHTRQLLRDLQDL